MKFSSLSLSSALLRRLEENGFEEMTPVQEAVIPLLMKQRDTVAEALTGSGKTLSFLVPLINKLITRQKSKNEKKQSRIRALILAPTRELAAQIYALVLVLIEQTEIRAECIMGGEVESMVHKKNENKEDAQRYPDVVVGSPGKVAGFLKIGGPECVKDVEFLVLDEADRLLSFGFSKEISEILRILPRNRQTAIFSATIPESVHTLSKVGMRGPMFVRVTNKKKVPEKLEIFSYRTTASQKMDVLYSLVPSLGKKVVVFFATCAQVDYFYARISKYLESCAEAESRDCGSGGGIELNGHSDGIELNGQSGNIELNGHSDSIEWSGHADTIKCNGHTPNANVESPGHSANDRHHTPNGNGYCAGPCSCTASRPNAEDEKKAVCTKNLKSTEHFQNENRSKNRDSPLSVFKNLYRLHRKLEQKERNRTYAGFNTTEEGVLLTTDISARGLDFQNVTAVLHFDLPQDPTTFIHRSGRTARYNKEGVCVFMCMPNEEEYIDFLRLRGIATNEYPHKTIYKHTEPLSNPSTTANLLSAAHSPNTEPQGDPEEPLAEAVSSSETGESTEAAPSRTKKEIRRAQRKDQEPKTPPLLNNVAALVSYIRSYKEHLLTHILNYKNLDYTQLYLLYSLKKKIKWNGKILE